MHITTILLIVLAVIVLWLIAVYNGLIKSRNRVDEAWSDIEVQMKRRYDLIPNLVSTVKGYVKHEKDAIKMVTDARENMMKAGNVKERIDAENQLSSALKTVFAIAENYPDLKASDNFKLLQEQLEGIENKVAYSRQFYNDSVLDFNNSISTIPGTWFASALGRNKSREYFEAAEGERKPVKVEF